MCMGVCLHGCLRTTCVHAHRGQKWELGLLQLIGLIGVTDGFEPWVDGYWESNPSPLEEQPALLTSVRLTFVPSHHSVSWSVIHAF